MNHYILKPDKKTPQSMCMTWDVSAETPEEAVKVMLSMYEEQSQPDRIAVYDKATEFQPCVELLLSWENPNKRSHEAQAR